jgi:molybdate transport system regulatory protein
MTAMILVLSQRCCWPLIKAVSPKRARSEAKLAVRFKIHKGAELALGEGKIELLQAIRATGSIQRAARKIGVSYMHAWNLVQTLNRCFTEPVVTVARGGRQGGGARITVAGRKVITLYARMLTEARRAIDPFWDTIQQLLGEEPAAELRRPPSTRSLFSFALYSPLDNGSSMEQSIRNEVPGKVVDIVSDKVLSEVVLETAVGPIAAVITTRSVREMKLKEGDEVFALIKATNVSLRRSHES